MRKATMNMQIKDGGHSGSFLKIKWILVINGNMVPQCLCSILSCAIWFTIWPLRISSLKIITPLLFAYSHNKYKYLSMTTIYNSLTCPDEFHQFFC